MPSLTEIDGVGPSLAAACVKNNYRTIAKIAAAKPSELSKVPGISEKRAAQIISSAKSLLPKPRKAVKAKQRTVGPVKTGPKAAAPNRPKQSSKKEKKMSKKDVKAKVKKLKKKIKNLKTEKKELLAKENKKSKKKKSSKKK